MLPPVKLVTFDNCYKNATNESIRKYFSDLILLRREGYGPVYPDFFLPLDAADYVIWQHLYCFEENGILSPFAGLRMVSLKRCDYYKLTIPLLKTAQDAGALEHQAALQNIFEKHREPGTGDCVYSAGLSISQKFKGNKEISQLTREITSGFHWVDKRDWNVATYVCAAILRFKTQKWFTDLGYKPLEHQGKKLSSIRKMAAGGEEMLLMHMPTLGQGTRDCYEKHKALFEGRVFLPEVGTVKEETPRAA